MRAKLKIEVGQRFNMLTILNEVYGEKLRRFKVLCDCGNTSEVYLSNLVSGHTKSCGCIVGSAVIHGMSKTKEYRLWQNMIYRCTNPNGVYYGIFDVQPEFVENFENFLSHIGKLPDYKGRWSVGRIDNDVGYVFGNIRWENSYQQNRNRKKFKSNTSGVTGVMYKDDGYRPHARAIARWYDLEGRLKSKSFSTKGIGKEAAIELAKQYREDMIEELNRNGAEYSDKHGKDSFREDDVFDTENLLKKLGVDYE